MNLPLFEETYRVSQLCEEVRSFLAEAFGSVWVVGEIQRPRQHRNGHLYFELIEKDDGDGICGRLDAVLFRGDRWRIDRALGGGGADRALADGAEVRCRGELSFYPPQGRVQLVLREVDPVFALGSLERRRRETLAALEGAGLLDANRTLVLAEVPSRLALVTSHGSAAYHDFIASLAESGWGFAVTVLHASVQGASAERELVSALAEAGRSGADCVALVRGGGARSDLAVFDLRSVAEAVARSPIPVLTGLGHEIDLSIADRMAHTALKTPTQVAGLLVERMEVAERRRRDVTSALGRAVGERLRSAGERVRGAERGVALARARLTAAARELDGAVRRLALAAGGRLAAAGQRRRALLDRLSVAAPRAVAREIDRPAELALAAARRAQARLERSAERLAGLERLARELSPARVLERGYSITRDQQGAVLRRPTAVASGDRITTTLAGGDLVSRVETA